MDHRYAVVVPAGNISLCDFTTIVDHNDCVGISERLQIDAREFARSAQVFDDAETVAKIVRDEQCIAVRTDRESSRIDRRAIAVVTR